VPTSRPNRQRTLALLPGLGGSLTDLANHGQLDRLLSYYLPAYLEHFARVRYFSYAPESVADFTADAELLRRLEVVAPRRSVPRRLRALQLGLGPGRGALRECGLARALHAPGALPALLAGVPYACTYGYFYDALTGVSAPGPLRPPVRAAKAALVRAALRLLLGRAARVIVTSGAVEAEARRLGAARVWRIPNGVDVDLFAPSSGRTAGRRYDVVFVGRLSPEKDLATLVAAAARLQPRPRLCLVGDGPERAAVEAAAAAAGVPADLPGLVEQRALPEVLASARCFVLPSRTEGHPKALIEALAAGLPCIASDIGAHRELAGAGAVLTFPAGDAAALAARLQQVLADDRLARGLASAGRALACRDYDLRRLVADEARRLADLAAAATGAAPGARAGPG